MSEVGIISPGAMGVSIAASLKSAGHEVYWASAGRSSESRERAAEHQLTDVQSLTELCARCRIILSVCPPHAAEAVAQSVIDGGFRGCTAMATRSRRRNRERSARHLSTPALTS